MKVYFNDFEKEDNLIRLQLYRYTFVYKGDLFVVLADDHKVQGDTVIFSIQGLIIAIYPLFVVNSLKCDRDSQY